MRKHIIAVESSPPGRSEEWLNLERNCSGGGLIRRSPTSNRIGVQARCKSWLGVLANQVSRQFGCYLMNQRTYDGYGYVFRRCSGAIGPRKYRLGRTWRLARCSGSSAATGSSTGTGISCRMGSKGSKFNVPGLAVGVRISSAKRRRLIPSCRVQNGVPSFSGPGERNRQIPGS